MATIAAAPASPAVRITLEQAIQFALQQKLRRIAGGVGVDIYLHVRILAVEFFQQRRQPRSSR